MRQVSDVSAGRIDATADPVRAAYASLLAFLREVAFNVKEDFVVVENIKVRLDYRITCGN